MALEVGDRVEVITVDDSTHAGSLIGKRGVVTSVGGGQSYPLGVKISGYQDMSFSFHEVRKLSILEVLAEESR